MKQADWQPSATLATLQLRAQLYQTIRHFFAQRHVLEVETPILSHAGNTDPTIASFQTQLNQQHRLFLHTSPELAMKRLLATGYGAIYQITKVFRDGEIGRWHNPEFTMLEWYRPHFKKNDLIQEVDEFLQIILHTSTAKSITYIELFQQYINLHPLEEKLTILQDYVKKFNLNDVHDLDRDSCLQLILSHDIEPHLGHEQPLVITNFPATQAALAQKNQTNPLLAERFEFYVNGIELANGFYELTDPIEQRQRFEQDLATRQTHQLPLYPIDDHFLTALDNGLPECSGVAMGIDRLLMLMTKAQHIREVLSFSIDNA